jgi:hypothetical protein
MWLGAFGSAWRTLTAAVAEQLTCLLAGEAPLDRAPLAIGPALPAAVSRRSIGRFGMRRLPMHARTSEPMAISAWFSQLACLGV